MPRYDEEAGAEPRPDAPPWLRLAIASRPTISSRGGDFVKIIGSPNLADQRGEEAPHNGDHFASWIKDRIEAYGLVEGTDFDCSPILGSEGRGAHNRIEWSISIDMARDLAMVERNDQGKRGAPVALPSAVKNIPPKRRIIAPLALGGLFADDGLKSVRLRNRTTQRIFLCWYQGWYEFWTEFDLAAISSGCRENSGPPLGNEFFLEIRLESPAGIPLEFNGNRVREICR